ncbi:hypothetical protein MKW98_029303 [Papaver atlanticum]|uniref:Uncharacterized protein n=1 Tax=Papaver atlanticum TaxID=357466 RepID=A0AAD4SJD7_9MAGN|nr:hypothetical protein MKW98_029303 [Papaver atlanticum]
MERSSLFLLLAAAIFVALYCHASSVEKRGVSKTIHLLRPKSYFGSELIQCISCNGWCLAVETNNFRNWKTIFGPFDISETILSNVPYYAKHGFGVQPYNDTSFNFYSLFSMFIFSSKKKDILKKSFFTMCTQDKKIP